MQKLKNSKVAVAVVIIAILIIPVCYSFFYLKAFWDPYNNLQGINVAVVNLDEGENGENRGEELAQKLEDKNLMNISVVYDSDEALQGLINKEYYATITVPKDFTKELNNAENKDRQSTTITYSPNQKSNYIASQILNNAAQTIETEVREEVTKEVVANLSDKLNEVPEQMEDVADGSTKITDGANKLNSGATKLADGAETLNSKYAEFDKGIETAYSGSEDLSSGLNELNKGATTLVDGVNSLEKATKNVSGITDGVEKLEKGSETLKTGIDSYVSGTNTAIEQIEETVSNLKTAQTSLQTNLQKYIVAHPEAMGDSNFQAIVKTLQGMEDESSDLTGLETLKQSGTKLKKGAKELNSGIQEFASQAVKLKELPKAISKLDSGAQELQKGIAQVADGGETLNGGLKTLSSSSKQVASGIESVANGGKELQSGTQDLVEGAQTFNEEIDSGIEDTKEELKALDGLDTYTAESVNVEEEDYAKVDSYGECFSPFFISLSLWVGAMIMLIIFYYDLNDRFKLLGRNAKNKHLRTVLYLLLGAVQGLVLAVLLQFALPLNVTNEWLYLGACALIGMAFTAIVQFLIITLDDVGKFICIIFLIIQLVASGGTFPIETEPAFFQDIYAFMPMSYTIKLLKEITIQIDPGMVMPNIIVLGSLLVIFAGLTFIKDSKFVQEKILKRNASK